MPLETSISWDAARLGRLVRKELLEILRDRRTILTLVLMPVLLYPLLTIAFQQFFAAQRFDPNQGLEYQLGFANQMEAMLFSQFREEGEGQLEKSGTLKKKPVFKGKVNKDLSKSDVEEMVRAGSVDL